MAKTVSITKSAKGRWSVHALDPDPFVEKVAALISQSKMTDSAIADAVGAARNAHMSPSTVASVRNLAVKRPQNYTLDWILFALGYVRKIVDRTVGD